MTPHQGSRAEHQGTEAPDAKALVAAILGQAACANADRRDPRFEHLAVKFDNIHDHATRLKALLAERDAAAGELVGLAESTLTAFDNIMPRHAYKNGCFNWETQPDNCPCLAHGLRAALARMKEEA